MLYVIYAYIYIYIYLCVCVCVWLYIDCILRTMRWVIRPAKTKNASQGNVSIWWQLYHTVSFMYTHICVCMYVYIERLRIQVISSMFIWKISAVLLLILMSHLIYRTLLSNLWLVHSSYIVVTRPYIWYVTAIHNVFIMYMYMSQQIST